MMRIKTAIKAFSVFFVFNFYIAAIDASAYAETHTKESIEQIDEDFLTFLSAMDDVTDEEFNIWINTPRPNENNAATTNPANNTLAKSKKETSL